jgi:hypothetical protein
VIAAFLNDDAIVHHLDGDAVSVDDLPCTLDLRDDIGITTRDSQQDSVDQGGGHPIESGLRASQSHALDLLAGMPDGRLSCGPPGKAAT